MNHNIETLDNELAKMFDTISTSFHEAAHTIYGLIHLFKVNSVLIFNNENNRVEGLTNYMFFEADDFPDPIFSFIANSEISIKYSGLIAEKYLLKSISGIDKYPFLFKNGSYDDFNSATQIIKKYNFFESKKERYLYKKELIKLVSKEIEKHWDAITLIAHALIKYKKLSYNRIKVILTTKSKNKKFWIDKFNTIELCHKNYNSIEDDFLISILRKDKLI